MFQVPDSPEWREHFKEVTRPTNNIRCNFCHAMMRIAAAEIIDREGARNGSVAMCGCGNALPLDLDVEVRNCARA